MAAELYGRGQKPGIVAPNAYMAEPSAPKPTRALAPANEQGFYSPTEAAALNLQRKSGNGQAFLNDLLKQENVKPDEISAMGLDTFLKDKKNVTAAEVQDYIAKNKIQLGETVYGQSKPTAAPAVQSTDDFFNFDDLGDQIGAAIDPNNLPKPTKYDQYSLPGGENYREVVLTLPDQKDALLPEIRALGITKSADNITINYVLQKGGSDELAQKWSDAIYKQYTSGHFDEPNILAHLRMSAPLRARPLPFFQRPQHDALAHG
jgi:hypothetical protein